MNRVPNGGALSAFRLDDAELVVAGDPGGLLRQTAAAAAQVRMSVRAAEEAGLAPSRPRTIVVAATGASAWAGEVLAAIAGPQAPVQIVLVRGPQLPGWTGAADLVFAVSASGKRQQTLSVAQEAARRGCELIGVGPAGTPLAEITGQARGTFVPVTAGPARSVLWGLTVPLLVTASALGVLRLDPAAYESAASVLEEVSHQCRPASESFVNPAKSLALDIAGTLPLIWGGSPLATVAARRFGSLLALNAKYPALPGSFPEVAFDQVAILDGPFAPSPAPLFPGAEDLDALLEQDDDPADSEAGSAEPRLILIADETAEYPAVTQARTGTMSLASDRGLLVSELVLDGGEDPLRRLARITQLLDYTSVYLAIACGVDPLASAARGDLRDLAERPEGP
ncbi:MAG TPA: SIS domain-containing protein [Trebonia sp.]